MIVLPNSSASLSWREVVSMFSTTPRVCSNWRIVVCSWRSRMRRSVMTTIESKTRRSEISYSVELLIARIDQEALAGLTALIVLFFDLMNELAHEVEHAVPCPGFFPQVAGGVTLLRRRHGRIAGAAEFAAIKGKKARPRPGK